MTRGPDDTVLRSVQLLAAGDELVTQLADGTVVSTVSDAATSPRDTTEGIQ